MMNDEMIREQKFERKIMMNSREINSE